MRRLVYCFVVVLVAVPSIAVQAEPVGSSHAQRRTAPLKELQRIGLEIVGAVLTHDVDALTRYSRPDLIASDRKGLNDPKSELSCEVFGTCAVKPKTPSVYDFLRSAKSLAVTVNTIRWGDNMKEYAVIYFYDAAEVKRNQLFNSVELCNKHDTAIFTWVFRSVQGRWVAAHPPFDTETDWFCPMTEEVGRIGEAGGPAVGRNAYPRMVMLLLPVAALPRTCSVTRWETSESCSRLWSGQNPC